MVYYPSLPLTKHLVQIKMMEKERAKKSWRDEPRGMETNGLKQRLKIIYFA